MELIGAVLGALFFLACVWYLNKKYPERGIAEKEEQLGKN
jgi:hypothetical protein